jgi:hypothetical protein
MSGKERICAVLEPCARVNRTGLPWRQFDWQSLLGKNYLLVCLVTVVMSPVPVAPIL